MASERQKNIRNFSIIAHIDHGKSTLADRFIEVTGALSGTRKGRSSFRQDGYRRKVDNDQAQAVRLFYQSEETKRIYIKSNRYPWARGFHL